MQNLRTTPIHDRFGVEIHDVDLREVDAEILYPEIRAAFERHSLILFRGQNIAPEKHMALAKLFGPLEDRQADEHGRGEAGFEVPQVSNVKIDNTLAIEGELKNLQLQANFLWHTDSTFLPTPALSNILICRVPAKHGGATEFSSTRAAWADMPDELKSRIRGQTIWHRYAHSRAKISKDLAAWDVITKWPDKGHGAVWTNPVNGQEALYIASHACRIDGMEDDAAQSLIDELTGFCTRDHYIYRHDWAAGDVLIWDERATLHRGTPWPYDQPRVLSSICSSVRNTDGLPI